MFTMSLNLIIEIYFKSGSVGAKSLMKVIIFNRRCRIYSGFHLLLAHYVPLFEHVKNKIFEIS